jgi:hypothetical protein
MQAVKGHLDQHRTQSVVRVRWLQKAPGRRGAPSNKKGSYRQKHVGGRGAASKKNDGVEMVRQMHIGG